MGFSKSSFNRRGRRERRGIIVISRHHVPPVIPREGGEPPTYDVANIFKKKPHR
jgi:hypothetical protein